MRDEACLALAVGIDCSAIDCSSRSKPARIAALFRGGGSTHEHKTPSASAWRSRIAVGLNFLSVDRQGRREEAHATLAGVYGWFTEGFDTADLKAAKALLETLA